MDKRRGIIIGVLIAVACLITASGCITSEKEKVADEEGIGVVVTILPQADFVENVGGDKVHVTVMVPPGASPHTYEPTPSQLRAVSKAKIYFKVGSGVEFENAWMDKIRGVNPDMQVVDCATGISKMGKDPHIWNSPLNAKVMVENICDGLIEIDHEHEVEYRTNRDKYLQELDDIDAYIHERLDGFTNTRVFMSYHPAFGYFASEYNLTQIAIEHKGKAPTPKVIRNCIDQARQYNLSYVYVAPQFATKDAEVIAHEIGGQTVFIDPLPLDYTANMRSIVGALSPEME
ncbi:zinc ABC transporter substrate-binding protein [ANME-1 cluster archaeon AG-394-G21]|nr:zinc ABC transporter substrate-binding protein [ANME-1 cluster archaeon AG-394-G21]